MSGTDGETPEWETVIVNAIRASLADVHVAIPGRVETYDPATQTASVKPMIRRTLEAEDAETIVEEDLPILPSVPVAFPRSGDFFVSFPLAPGSFGQILFNERSIDLFRARGVEESSADERTHSLAGAVFFPVAVCPAADALAGADGSDMVVGEDGGTRLKFPPGAPAEVHAGGATDFVVLEGLLQFELSAISSAIGGLGGTYVPALTGTAATKLKAE